MRRKNGSKNYSWRRRFFQNTHTSEPKENQSFRPVQLSQRVKKRVQPRFEQEREMSPKGVKAAVCS